MLQALSLAGTRLPPLIAVAERGTRLVVASRMIFRFFDVSDSEALAARLLAGHDPGSRRLAHLCQNLTIDGAPRLERLRFLVSPASEVVTFLCRRVLFRDDQTLFIAAALGMGGEVLAERPAQPDEARQARPESGEPPPPRAFPLAPSPASPLVSWASSTGGPAQAASRMPDVLAEAAPVAATSVAEPVPDARPRMPAPQSVQAIQAMLRARWPVKGTVRFLWQTDGDGTCTHLTPQLAEIVGAANADLVGRGFPDLAARLDPTGRLAGALAGRDTWSGVDVAWPITDASAAVDVRLGAIPVFGRERAFEGFRGYGVIRLDRIAPHERLRLMPFPATEPASATVVTFPGAAKAMSSEDRDAFRSIGDELRDRVGVVDATAREAETSDGAERPPAPDAVAPERDAVPPPAGADLRSAPSITAPPPLLESAPVPGGPAQERAGSVARNGLAVLDRLALAVLVSRDNVPIFANRAFLELTGFADEDALHAAGGLGYLFGDMPGNASGAEAVGLRTHGGAIIPAIARMQRTSWDGLPATLLTLGSAAGPASGGQTDDGRKPDRAAPDTGEPPAPAPEGDELRDLRAILETATDGVAIIDAAGNVRSLNRSGEALFGCDRGAVTGKPFLDLFAANNRGLAAEYLEGLTSSPTKRLLNDGREILVQVHGDGTLPVFMTLGRLGSSADEADGSRFCALFRDLTPLKRVERDLDHARGEVEAGGALEADFLARVSQEIRTPLNAIGSLVDVLLEERSAGAERHRGYLSDIRAAGRHVVSLVDDLLDLTRIKTGRIELAPDAVDIGRMVGEVVAELQPRANRERIIMRLSLAPGLPPVRADGRTLRRCLNNVLLHAVRFNEPGGQVIVASTRTDEGHVVVRIRDTGPGISDDDLATVLDPLGRLGDGSRGLGAAGFGLPLAKALVEANEATFIIRSKLDQGTMIEISFPPARVLAG